MDYKNASWKMSVLEENKNNYPEWTTFQIRDQIKNVHLCTVGAVDNYYNGEEKHMHAVLMTTAPDLLRFAEMILGQCENGYLSGNAFAFIKKAAETVIEKAKRQPTKFNFAKRFAVEELNPLEVAVKVVTPQGARYFQNLSAAMEKFYFGPFRSCMAEEINGEYGIRIELYTDNNWVYLE